jgi:CRISPR system Cascade subunit CasA
MNLISDAWIPIRRKGGEEERIAPWEVTTRYSDDPIVALAAPRPDFNGALIQFLIGYAIRPRPRNCARIMRRLLTPSSWTVMGQGLCRTLH